MVLIDFLAELCGPMAFRSGTPAFRQSGLLGGKQVDALIEQINALDIEALLKEQAQG